MDNTKFIEKLLDGVEVEWLALGDVAKYSDMRIDCTGIDEKNYVGVDNLLQNRAGKTNSTYVPTEGRLIEYRLGDILIGNIRPYLKKIWLANQSGGTNGDVLVVRPTHESLSSGYLHQVLTDENFFAYNMQHAKGAKMPRGDKAKILEYKFPIPCPENPKKSLEIQAEIVRILDTFTELTAELTSELTARKKQYNYYRDQLLSFEDGEVELKRLGDIVRIKNGKDHKTLGDGEYPVYGSGGIMRYADTYAYNKPSVLIPRKGSLGNLFFVDVPFWNVDTIFYTQIDEVQICPKFLYYFLTTVGLGEMNQAGGVPSQTQSVLNELKIPVPPLAEQARIVAILDKFDALTNSLTEGLPREIELRQKQYEYYRDVLLSFPKPEEAEA